MIGPPAGVGILEEPVKVVFLENVPSVANAGEVKEVKAGYGRNFLIPRRLAVPATASVLRQVEHQHQAADKKAAKVDSEAGQLAQQLDGLTVDMIMKAGAQGRLYGSVTTAHVAEELEKITRRSVDRRKVHLGEPIRRLGRYPVTVRLSSEHSATVTIQVRTEGAPTEPSAPEAAAAASTTEEEQ